MDKRSISDLVTKWETSNEIEDYNIARSAVDEAMKENSADAGILFHDGFLHETIAKHHMQQGRESYLKAQDLDPEELSYHAQFIKISGRLLDYQSAINRYKELLDKHSDTHDQYYYLALAYYMAGQYTESEMTIDAGRRVKPSDWKFVYLLGEIRAKRGLTDEALTLFEWSHKLNSDDLGSVYSQAFLLEEKERYQEAIEKWEYILAWHDRRGYQDYKDWGMKHIERVKQRLAND